MKKIFTLIASAFIALSANAFTDEWKSTSSSTSPVALSKITATFIGEPTEGAGTWSFSNSYAVGSVNSMQVEFSTTAAGNLTIVFGGAINTGKKIHMRDADGNGLTATLASDKNVTIDDNTNPAAEIASGDGLVYTLEANKTYTFSASGTAWRLASFKFTDEKEIIYTTEWNFSNWADESTGFSNQVKNNLGLLGSYKDAETQITNFGRINSSKKGAYTKRFQFGGGGAPLAGTGTPTQRFVYFNVTGDANVSVQVVSSNSDERILYITDGTNIISETSVGSTLTEAKANYTGSAGVIYIYANGGINVYDIKANNVGTTVELDDSTKPTPTAVEAVAESKAESKAPVKVITTNGIQIGKYNVAGQQVK